MDSSKFDQWMIIELFGHQKIAGRVIEEEIGGMSFLRVDVPETKEHEAFTKYFGQGAIYAMTVVDKESVTVAAERIEHAPVSAWSLRSALRRQLGSGEVQEEFDFDDEFQPEPDDGIPF